MAGYADTPMTGAHFAAFCEKMVGQPLAPYLLRMGASVPIAAKMLAPPFVQA